MAFDARGRLFIGMGPQYRNPKPDTPGDSVVLVTDEDGDGVADHVKEFATGLNCIQGLAWHGRDLWIANSPDLTIVRDLDGDDVADEYIKVFTDLGNIEHALHGLVWAPDGKLYMSKGNSKGINDSKQKDRIAPAPFRELFGQAAPPGTPDFPKPQTFTAGSYKHTYQDPKDDWGLMGGVLRCDDGGAHLEIVSRGFRNPWDIAHDDGFHWLCTDNDQNEGDRVMMPFYGAHFGWNHAWSSSWTGKDHLPTVPLSHEVFDGSGTGIVFGSLGIQRGVFFINDWLRKFTFVFKPTWEGSMMKCEGGTWQPFIIGGKALFRPTDIAFGPDGDLWCLSWSRGYGAEYDAEGHMTSEGRIYRVTANDHPAAKLSVMPMRERTVPQLIEAFSSPLPVHRIDAQDELVRRGPAVARELIAALEAGTLSEAQETWTSWALGRIGPNAFFERALEKPGNLRTQALRILAQHPSVPLPTRVKALTQDTDARVRFEAVECLWQARQSGAVSVLEAVAAQEQDRLTYYSAWRALRDLAGTSALKGMLHDTRGGVRRAALLALLEDGALSKDEVRSFEADGDKQTQTLAQSWASLMNGGGQVKLVKDRGVDVSKLAPITGPPPVLEPQTTAVTTEAALAAMPTADPSRGRLLVLHPQGAGCIVCHYIAGHGNHFGPELDGIGDRAEAKHLVQSIVDPSAVITEGFNSHVITTAQGTQMGILLEESGLSVTLGLVTGQRVRIMRADITKHETLPVSAMPPFNMTLSAQQCADIAAWLQTRKAGVPLEIQKKNKKPKAKH
jgi:putative membrane-bound dehydrogenase-like protein